MKKLAVVLAALMMLSCSTVFMAAESPSPSNKPVVEADISIYAGDYYEMMETNPEYAEEIQAQINEAASVVEKQFADDLSNGYEVLGFFQIWAQELVPEGGVNVTFNINGIKAGDKIAVYHMNQMTGAWDARPVSSVVDGAVVAHFDSFSPVMIVKLADEPVADNSIYYWLASPFGAANTTAATLPKTGAVVVLPFAAMACLAGAVVCGRKEK